MWRYIALVSVIGLAAQLSIGVGLTSIRDGSRLPFTLPHWVMMLAHHWAFVVALAGTLFAATVERQRRVRMAALFMVIAIPAVIVTGMITRYGRLQHMEVIFPISQFLVGTVLGIGLALAYGQGRKVWIWFLTGAGLCLAFVAADRSYNVLSRHGFGNAQVLSATAHAVFGLLEGFVVAIIMQALQSSLLASMRQAASDSLEDNQAARPEDSRG